MFDDILGPEKNKSEIEFTLIKYSVEPKEMKLKDGWTIETKPDRPFICFHMNEYELGVFHRYRIENQVKELIRLSADGSCNVGTSSPEAKLNVHKSVSVKEMLELLAEAREEIIRLHEKNFKLERSIEEYRMMIFGADYKNVKDNKGS